MTLPDRFIDHDTPTSQIRQASLDSKSIVQTALKALGIADAADLPLSRIGPTS